MTDFSSEFQRNLEVAGAPGRERIARAQLHAQMLAEKRKSNRDRLPALLSDVRRIGKLATISGRRMSAGEGIVLTREGAQSPVYIGEYAFDSESYRPSMVTGDRTDSLVRDVMMGSFGRLYITEKKNPRGVAPSYVVLGQTMTYEELQRHRSSTVELVTASRSNLQQNPYTLTENTTSQYLEYFDASAVYKGLAEFTIAARLDV